MLQRKLNMVFDGGASKRYHTVDTLRTQDIAAHSFGVAWLCELLTQGKASKNLIMAALAHDLAEYLVGDVPSPTKRALGLSELLHEHEYEHLKRADLTYEEKLSSVEVKILKLADCMEGMLFCVRERAQGNKSIFIVYERFMSYIEDMLQNGVERDTFNLINKAWEAFA